MKDFNLIKIKRNISVRKRKVGMELKLQNMVKLSRQQNIQTIW